LNSNPGAASRSFAFRLEKAVYQKIEFNKGAAQKRQSRMVIVGGHIPMVMT
jgi:hypothetical protein